jgi:hypothetical protein
MQPCHKGSEKQSAKVCVERWCAGAVIARSLRGTDACTGGDKYGRVGFVDTQDKLAGDGIIETVNQQADRAMLAVGVSVDIRLVNQQRRLADNQERCE